MANRFYHLDFDTKAGLEKVLDDLIDNTKDLKTFKSQYNESDDTSYTHWLWWNFAPGEFAVHNNSDDFNEIPYNNDNLAQKEIGLYISEGIYVFFKRAIAEGLEEKIIILIQQIGKLQNRINSPIWCDDETLLGSEPAVMLALHDVKYLPLYTWFVKQIELDALDHETMQGESFDKLLEKQGYGKEIIEHLATIGSLTQFGSDIIDTQCSTKAFAEYLDKEWSIADFKKLVVENYKAKQYSKEEIEEYTEHYFESLEKLLAPDDYVLIDLKNKNVALTGRAPIDRDMLNQILEYRGAKVSTSVKKDTEILLCPDASSTTGKVKKAMEQGVQLISYKDAFNLPAWKNYAEKKRHELYAAVRERNLELTKDILANHGIAIENDTIRDIFKNAIDDGPMDEMFHYFLDNHLEGREDTVITRLACDYGNDSTAKLKYVFDKYNIDVTKLSNPTLSVVKNKYYQSDKATQIENLKFLASKGVDINAANAKGETPLHEACDDFHYDLSLIQTLLDLGANPNAPDQYGKTPFAAAAETKDFDFYDEDEGNHTFDFCTDYSEPGFEKYLYKDDGEYQKGFDMVKLLVESGKAELDMKKTIDSGCKTPLCTAAWEPNWQIVDYLLDVVKIDPTPGEVNQSGEKDPFLSWLVRSDAEEFNVAVLKKAIAKGANPNQWCDYNRNPLFYISWRGIVSLEGIAVLIDAGGDPFFEDKNGDCCAKVLQGISAEQKEELYGYIQTEDGKKVLDKVFED